MAKISCEVCGSHKIIKQDEVFICQKCGTRYSLQDVRKKYKVLKAQMAAAADAQDQPAKPASTKKATPAAETQPAQPATPKAAPNQSSWLAQNTKLLIACFSAVLVIAVSLVIWLVLSTRNNNVITLQNYDSYVASTQSYHHDVQVPTNYELWEDFKIYFEDYYNVNRADQTMEKAAVYLTYGCEIMTDPQSRYKWLGDYIKQVAAEQGYKLTNNPATKGMEASWRWHIHCFFNCTKNYDWPETADFYRAGQRSEWADAYRKAHR